MRIRTKRVYEPASKSDGVRVLVDRVWPRGVSKEAAGVAAWRKGVAPSTELRKWFAHDPGKWDEFKRRYAAELDAASEEVDALLELARGRTLTLVYSAKDEEHNQAVALREYLEAR